MKHFSFKALLCAAALFFTVLSAAPVAVSWEGGTGGALAAPKLTIGQETYNDHPVITCESIVDGEYQGILGTIAGKPDMSKYTGVRFFARCNFIDKGACVFRLNCRGTDGIVYWIYTEFTLTNQWTEVTIPFNPPFWKAAEGEAKFGIAESLSIYPYAAMNHKGCKLEVAGLQLIEPGSAAAPLTVQAYRYLNAPDTGDPQRKALTDGSMATQAYWRQYSDDAEIIFDLGSIYAVTDISVTANSIPAHNFSEMRITASVDGKDYYPVTILRNTRTDTKPVEHSIAFQGKSIGRFFRFRAVKPRPDFQIYIGEVKFSGYIPTVEEEKADAVNRYVIGPEMPARDSKAYVKAVLGDYTLWVNQENGVLNGVQFRDKLWIERLANRYVRQSRAEDKHFSAYDDKISDLKVTGRSVSFTAVNPGLPGITLSKCYELDATGALLETVRVNKTRALPREFLQISTDVILNQAFRENGVYESAGAGHTLSREFARDIRMETEACNFPVLSFENDTEDVTVFHSRIRANGKFIYNDAVVEEARLLMFLANGWRMPLLSCVPADADKMELSGTLRLSITDGGLLNAYDSYLSNPEVKEYLAPIRRPAWLRDQMMHGAPGWDGLCKGVSERYYENQNKLFDRGYYISAMREDLDFEWGAFRTEGIVEDWFGGQKTAQELEDLLAELRRIHPRLKVGLYTWLWTSFTYQDIVKKHPEWFVSENRSGTVACWFPGVNTNWLRLWTPESVDEAATSVMAMIKRYNCDNWYLDGGGAGSFSKDFKRMIIDDPHGATTLYQRIRKELQEYNPESFIHFNSPMNPLGDMGYLESFSGVMTREWRRGAAWMWKFKMFQYKDPLHTPLYIYWLPNVDGAFHNYMVGTALMPTALSRNVDQREIPYISARYETRMLALTDARPLPNWRHDQNTDTEVMTLTQENAGFVFINHHGKDADVPVSVDAAPMGINGDAPVHEWEVIIRDARQWDGQWGQPAIIEGYRKSRWAGESALIPVYHGTRAPEARLERTFSLGESQAKLWVMTQCPAIIWSLDSLPSQHRIPSTPGAGITGTYPDFTFNTEYAENEIAFIVPAGRRVAALTVNGEKSGFRYGRDGNALLAIVNIAGAGKHSISVKLADAAAADHQSLAVTAKVEGSRLSGRVTGNGSDTVTVSIYNEGALCFTDTVGADGTFAVDLPATTRDGSYRIAVADLTGKRTAETALAIRGLARPTALMVEMPHIYPEIAVKDAVKGIYRRQGTEFTPDASYAEADATSGQLRVGTLPAIATYYSTAIAGLEMKAKRYLEIELSSNLDYYNKYGQEPKRHFVRIDCPETSAALMFDFHTRDGYTRRTLAGLGQQYLERGTSPAKWGKGSKPDAFYALTNYIQSADGSNVRFWLDAEALEAPADWDGQLWVSLLFQIGAPNRQFNARILRTADRLPAGAECLKPVSLQAKVERQEFRVQQFTSGTKVTGDWNAQEWQTVAELPPMTILGTPGMPAPYSSRSRVAADENNIYIFVLSKDIPGRIWETERGAQGTPWFADSAEFWIQRKTGGSQILHAVVDAANHTYAEHMQLTPKADAKAEQLAEAPFTTDIRKFSDGWSVLFTLPRKNFQGDVLAFNIMRNRSHAGALSNYTTVPGNAYFCGEVYFLKLQ